MTIEKLEEVLETEKINGIIYKATNIVNGKVYIGQTTKGIELRKNQHHYYSKKYPNGTYFYRALVKHSEDNFKWEVIDESDELRELNKKEAYWIKCYNSFGQGGYNLTDGG